MLISVCRINLVCLATTLWVFIFVANSVASPFHDISLAKPDNIELQRNQRDQQLLRTDDLRDKGLAYPNFAKQRKRDIIPPQKKLPELCLWKVCP